MQENISLYRQLREHLYQRETNKRIELTELMDMFNASKKTIHFAIMQMKAVGELEYTAVTESKRIVGIKLKQITTAQRISRDINLSANPLKEWATVARQTNLKRFVPAFMPMRKTCKASNGFTGV